MSAGSSVFDVATYEGEWLVNGDAADEDTNEYLDEKTAFDIASWTQRCPYCDTLLRLKSFDAHSESNNVWHYDRTYVFRKCSRCAHWEFDGFAGGNKCMDAQQTILLASVAAKFDQSLPPACSSELAQYLRRHADYWHSLPPQRMESLVADIFRANYRHSEVLHVGGPGDRGVDVIFIDAEHIRWLVQVKRRARPDKAEGFATLQSILGAMALQGCRHGVIVSTSDSFSHQARQAQVEARQYGYVIELIDKGLLDRIIGALLPATPWNHIFSHPALSHIEVDVQEHFGGLELVGQQTLF